MAGACCRGRAAPQAPPPPPPLPQRRAHLRDASAASAAPSAAAEHWKASRGSARRPLTQRPLCRRQTPGLWGLGVGWVGGGQRSGPERHPAHPGGAAKSGVRCCAMGGWGQERQAAAHLNLAGAEGADACARHQAVTPLPLIGAALQWQPGECAGGSATRAAGRPSPPWASSDPGPASRLGRSREASSCLPADSTTKPLDRQEPPPPPPPCPAPRRHLTLANVYTPLPSFRLLRHSPSYLAPLG
jgi:hypothetical protein